jgi:hypothetical protein
VAFGEVAPIFIQAQDHDIVSSVKWFGSDGSAQNIKVIKNTDTPFFVTKTGFADPIFGVENVSNTKFKHVEALIKEN